MMSFWGFLIIMTSLRGSLDYNAEILVVLEYYYDFGTWNQTVNYYDPKMSLVGETSYSEYQQPTTSTVRTEYKYVKFQMIKDSIIYWESKGVNFSTKKKKSQQ